MIVLDPPKFAPTAAQAEKAARGYKDINLLAFKLLRPNGIFFTFSCSGGIDAALFQKLWQAPRWILVWTRKLLSIFRRLRSSHLVGFPEGHILKD